MDLVESIGQQTEKLKKAYERKLSVNHELTRQLVSFQANKSVPVYRWFKYKEGFSAQLVKYVLKELAIDSGRLLDPFAGVGTALFSSANLGLRSTGIELLPIGTEVMQVRKMLSSGLSHEMQERLSAWVDKETWKKATQSLEIPFLKITRGAYPAKTEREIGHYIYCMKKERNVVLSRILRFALLCVLEEISYTRKDGQYLRWDHRSGRRQGTKSFDKGKIASFDEAISGKLREISDDLSGGQELFPLENFEQRDGDVEIVEGSVLAEMPKMASDSIDIIMTSPPYCNRYDYTRSYALELALLGVDEDHLKELRQSMVSCTVENREKSGLAQSFDKSTFEGASSAFQKMKLLQAILSYLEEQKEKKLLNNTGIPRMVRNYFYELSLVIFECCRVLKEGAPMVMVNDNVRYAGVQIPVDLILSEIAKKAGFETERIWILPIGKGNSSQQMGEHGREELRKCVYVWRKSKRD
jgi:DNA modification methylase